MQIAKKSSEKFLYKAILHFIVGFVGFIAIYIIFEINILSFLSLAFFLFIILKGGWHVFEFKSCKQEQSHELEIQNNTICFDRKHIVLDNSYLFFRLEECGKNVVVSLYQEKNAKILTIFSKIIFSPSEFKKFLELIKPYRKFDAFPWKKFNTHHTIYVCKKGIIIDGRELFYEEIEMIEWETEISYRMNARIESVTVVIGLKNNEKIIETFRNAQDKIYAKLLYVSLRLKGRMKDAVSGNNQTVASFNEILKELEKKECEEL